MWTFQVVSHITGSDDTRDVQNMINSCKNIVEVQDYEECVFQCWRHPVNFDPMAQPRSIQWIDHVTYPGTGSWSAIF